MQIFLTAARLKVLLLICLNCASALKQSEEVFWESYFSQGSTHQLSNIEDHPLSSPSGTISSPNYPNDFTLSAVLNQGYRISIRTLGYRNIAIFYRGERSDRCAGLMKINQIALCITSSSDSTTSGISSSASISSRQTLDLMAYSTNYTDVNITFTSNKQTQVNLTGYKIYYQLFTSHDSLMDIDPPVYLPTIIATSNGFPSTSNSSSSRQLSSSSVLSFHVNVALYQSITIRVLLAEFENASCDNTYLVVNGNKLCNGESNITIDVRNLFSNLTLICESKTAYDGVGMLAEITGILMGDTYDMCTKSHMIVYPSGAVEAYRIGSPGYPFTNSHIINDCHMELTGFDLAMYVIAGDKLFFSGHSEANCSIAQLQIGEDVRCSGSGHSDTFYHWGPDHIIVKYTQHTAVPEPAFSINFYLYTFKDICQSKNITSLPVLLKSPEVPTGKTYPANKRCFIVVNIPSVTLIAVNFSKMHLESSTSCRHDYVQIGPSHKYCGNHSHETLRLEVSSPFGITFRSDPLYEGEGFAMSIVDVTPYHVISSTPPSLMTTTQATAAISTRLTTSATTSPSKTPSAPPAPEPSTSETTESATMSMSMSAENVSSTTSKSSSKDNIKNKGTPSYVWAIVVPICLAVGLALPVTIIIIIKRRRNRLVSSGYGNVSGVDMGMDVDIGFENPIYGQGT